MHSSVPTAFASATGPAGIGNAASGSTLLPQPSFRRSLVPDKDADRLLVSVSARKTGDLQMLLTQLVNALREGNNALVDIALSECERLSAPIEQKFFYPRLCADYLLPAARSRFGDLAQLTESIEDIERLIDASQKILHSRTSGERDRLSLPMRLSGATRNSSGGEWPRAVLMAAHCLGFAESSTAEGRRQWAYDVDCSGPRSVAHQGEDQLAQLVADLRLLTSELGRQHKKLGGRTVLAAHVSSAAPVGASLTATNDCFTCDKRAAYVCHAKGCDGRARCGDCSEDFHQHPLRRHHEQDGVGRPLPPPLSHADSGNGTGGGSSLPCFYGPETARGRRVVRQLQTEVEDTLQRVKEIQDPDDRIRAIDRHLEVVSARTKQLYWETASSEGAFMSGKYAELLACEQTKDLLAEERRLCLRRLATQSESIVGGAALLGSRASAAAATPAATHRSLSSPGSLRSSSSSSALPYPKAGTVSSLQPLTLQPQGSTYADIVEQLRTAEKAGIRADLVADALRQIDYDRDRGRGDNTVATSGKVAITDWSMLVQSIRQAAMRANPIAVAGLTYKELCRAAAVCHLNVPSAAQHCITQRLQLMKVVQELVTIDTTAVGKCLEKHAAVLEAAGGTADMTAPAVALIAGDVVLEPFRQRIWNRPLERPRDDDAIDGLTSGGSSAGSLSGSRAADDGSRKLLLSRATRDLLFDRTANQARRARAMLVEGNLLSWMRALNALQILDEHPPGKFALSDVLHAVRECGGIRASLSYLQQECGTCFCMYPRNRLHELTCTTCQVCSDCLVSYFTIKIREKPVFDFTCPVCGEPDIASDRERASIHFDFLALILQNFLSKELLDAFQRKLRDYNLMNDPRFCWCTHCSSGYLYEGDPRRQPRTTCPDCKRSMCFSCSKPWEPQHEGLSCDLFAQWKADNDPSMQAEGVAKHLEQNGINCPKCQFRFLLAKGGCIHFTCTQCKHEFCAGCGHEFSHACRKLTDCDKKGLHCHHPRNCLYFMRDLTIQQLQDLLNRKSVEYRKALTAQQVEARRKTAHNSTAPTLLCRVMEQKEQASGLKDEACGKPATEEQAGLCEVHYKEYLVHLVNKAHIDPIVLMNERELTLVLQREGLAVPPPPKEKQKRDQYVASLRSHVEQNAPLPRLDSFRW